MTTDWSELEHAYGEASDVPRILEALASDREAEREQGYCDLFGSLCHQGSVYSATLAAIPALVAIADTPGYPDRAKLLAALARIADGQGEGIAMAEVRARLAAARDVFVGWVERGTVEEKIHALGVLRGPEFAACGARIVDVARTDAEPVVRAAAWEALLRVAPRLLPEVVEADPAVALVADLCTLEAEGAGAGPPLVVRVTEELFGPAGDEVRGWAEDGYVASPVRHCVEHVAAVDSPLVGALARRLVDTCEVAEATELAEALLDATFPASPSEDAPSPRPLDALTTKEHAVLEAVVQSEAAWGGRGQNGNLLYALARHGLPSGFDARAELATALGTNLRKRVVIVTPRQVPAAMEKAVLLGRASLADVPFAFMLRSSGLAEVIPEDPSDFPPALMADFERICRPILALVVQNTCPVSSAAFYPQLTPTAFEQIARELDFEIVPPNLAHANDPFTDEEEEEDDDEEETDAPVVPPCTAYADLGDDVRRALAIFAETLHAAGFSEAKASLATTQGMGEAGIAITPLAVGRRFGDLSNLEFGFHHDDDNGTFVRALVASRREGGTFTFRLFPSSPAFYEVLAAVDGSKEPSASMLPLASVTSRILVEQGSELYSIRPSDA